tara:strand:+ start:1826 stop:2032 length:207 start_codon:yes stop_codon:yes gene_type:complete
MENLGLTLQELDKLNTLSREQCIQYKFSFPPQKGWKKELRARIMEYNVHHQINDCESNEVLDSFFDIR